MWWNVDGHVCMYVCMNEVVPWQSLGLRPRAPQAHKCLHQLTHWKRATLAVDVSAIYLCFDNGVSLARRADAKPRMIPPRGLFPKPPEGNLRGSAVVSS